MLTKELLRYTNMRGIVILSSYVTKIFYFRKNVKIFSVINRANSFRCRYKIAPKMD